MTDIEYIEYLLAEADKGSYRNTDFIKGMKHAYEIVIRRLKNKK